MQNQIPIDFFDRQNKHVGSIVSPHFLQTTLWDAQHKLSDERSFDIGRRIIIGKLSNQVNLIKYYSKYHKEESVVATEVVAKMKVLLQELKKEVCIPDSNSLLMQYESQGALSYWEYVRHLLQDDDVGFDSRERRGATDLVNSMLNYGYALIYPRIWQALLKQKLNPYMGFIHYQSGNPNLVFDMIELFRCQAVDKVVISLIQKGEPLEIGSDGLTIATRKLLVSHVYERLQRYETYRGKSIPFEKIIQSQVRELAQSVETESTYKPYIAKW